MNSLQVLYFLYIGLLCHDTVVLQIALTHGIDTNYYDNRTENLIRSRMLLPIITENIDYCSDLMTNNISIKI